MLEPFNKRLLAAFVSGRTEGRDVANFDAELDAARFAFKSTSAIDGKDVSVALRAAGFNRSHDNSVPGQRITYRRRATNPVAGDGGISA